MQTTPSRFNLSFLCLFFSFSLLALVYSEALWAPFFWDDHTLIEQNPAVHSSNAWKEIFGAHFWELPHHQSSNAYYRPIIMASYVLDARIWRVDPFGFHFTNLIFHFANCGLFFWIARRMGAPPHLAALSMLLFGASPRLTESATWISGRTDLLATFGVILAIAFYCPRTSRQDSTLSDQQNQRTFGWSIIAALALLLGLLSKEVALAALPALIAYEWAMSRSSQKSVEKQLAGALLRLLPLLLATGLYLGLRLQAQTEIVASNAPFTLGQRLGTALQALGTYTWMFLTPFSPHLEVGTVGVFDTQKIILGLFSLLGILTLLFGILRRKTSPELATFFLLGIAAILPVLHLVPLPISTLAADRFLYLPWFGFCLALLSVLVKRWPSLTAKIQNIFVLVIALLALSFLWSTRQRNIEWQDELSLWRLTAANAEQITPKGGRAFYQLATTLMNQGRFEEAVAAYEKNYTLAKEFQALYPESQVPAKILTNWALALTAAGHTDDALPIVALIRQAKFNDAEDYFLFGSVLARLLAFEEADEQFALALARYPDYVQVKFTQAQIRQAAEIWNSLPPEIADEATPIRATRGSVYLLLGRINDAQRRWLEVVTAPDATDDLLQKAEFILENLRSLFGETEQTQKLAAAIEARKHERTEK